MSIETQLEKLGEQPDVTIYAIPSSERTALRKHLYASVADSEHLTEKLDEILDEAQGELNDPTKTVIIVIEASE